jgi:predicted O-methyltransferase YrrM
MSLMAVNVASDFGGSLRSIIKNTAPQKIIETGTYLGQGTTTIIASAIRDFGISLTSFYSIEVNPSHYRFAHMHLKDSGLLGFVTLINGLSVYRYQLPDKNKIKEKFLDADWPKEVYIDHNKEVRVDKYFEETNFNQVPDGMLMACLKVFDNSPDLVLLDSGGHIGEVEFDSLFPILKKPCLIALDDVFHVKHYQSLKKIQKNKQFEILELSREKFGFVITRFTPET